MLHLGQWKLLKNWIELVGSQKEIILWEAIDSLNQITQLLQEKEFVFSCEEQRKAGIGIFYLIEPYMVKKYQGYIVEANENLHVDRWELLEQFFCTSVPTIPGSGRDEYKANPMEVIAASLSHEAYIINALSKDYVVYYQEKDENGIYGANLETKHYIKIKSANKKQNKVEKVFQLL